MFVELLFDVSLFGTLVVYPKSHVWIKIFGLRDGRLRRILILTVIYLESDFISNRTLTTINVY